MCRPGTDGDERMAAATRAPARPAASTADDTTQSGTVRLRDVRNRNLGIRCEDVVEFEARVPDVAQSLRRILHQASRHQAPQRQRHIGWKRGPVRGRP